MDMESFVPPAVKEYFNEFLHGIPGQEGGAYEKIEILQELLDSLSNNFDSPSSSATKPPQATRVPGLITGHKTDEFRAFRDALEVHKRMVRNVEILSTHADMEKAYKRINRELTTRRQWRDFVYSAIEADTAYLRHKAIVDRGKELAPEIAKSAAELASHLSEFNLLDFDNFPMEFSSIWHLLSVSVDETWSELEPEKLSAYKRLLLGEIDPLPEPMPMPMQGTSQLSALRELLLEENRRGIRVSERNTRPRPCENNKLELPTAWASAPSVIALLRRLASSAKDFQPTQAGNIGLVLSNRQKHPRNQYVRGFAFLLLERNILLTTKVTNAMATVTDLLYDDPDKAMTPRAVRDALEKDFSF